jgi:uncharacterized HhH-GPD family protein
MAAVTELRWTGDPEADRLLARDPLALMVGMLLDQQFPMERAFHGPYDLKQRLGGQLDAAAIAEMDPEALKEVFSTRPALHRFPGSMAGRTQELCRHLVEHHRGRADDVWRQARSGEELFAAVRGLPGFGDQKARIFVTILAKRLGVQPPGYEEFLYPHPSVADVDGPESLAEVRAAKQAMKAKAKAEASGT